MKVYWLSVEYSYPGKKNLKGGFVFAFVKVFVNYPYLSKKDYAAAKL